MPQTKTQTRPIDLDERRRPLRRINLGGARPLARGGDEVGAPLAVGKAAHCATSATIDAAQGLPLSIRGVVVVP